MNDRGCMVAPDPEMILDFSPHSVVNEQIKACGEVSTNFTATVRGATAADWFSRAYAAAVAGSNGGVA